VNDIDVVVWTFVTKLAPASNTANAFCGSAVSLSGKHIVVLCDGQFSVFEFTSAGAWNLQQTISGVPARVTRADALFFRDSIVVGDPDSGSNGSIRLYGKTSSSSSRRQLASSVVYELTSEVNGTSSTDRIGCGLTTSGDYLYAGSSGGILTTFSVLSSGG